MKIPFVIDNIAVRLADVLNDLLAQQPGMALDIATAYFSIRGYQQLRATLPNVADFRLLIGNPIRLRSSACGKANYAPPRLPPKSLLRKN